MWGFIEENRVLSAICLVVILGVAYVAHWEYECRSLGGIPFHGQCVKMQLIDME